MAKVTVKPETHQAMELAQTGKMAPVVKKETVDDSALIVTQTSTEEKVSSLEEISQAEVEGKECHRN